MAASSSSADYTSNSSNEKYSPNDGPSDVTRAGIQRRTVHDESSSFMQQVNNSQDGKSKGKGKANFQDSKGKVKGKVNFQDGKDNGKGMAIISGASDFDEPTGGKVVTLESLEAERSPNAGINNLHDPQIRMGIYPSVSDTQGKEIDGEWEIEEKEIDGEWQTEEIDREREIDGEMKTSMVCGCCCWEFPLEKFVQCPTGHLFCFKCLRRRIKEIIYGGSKAHASLSCVIMGGCKESIPLSEIRRALPNDIIEKYEERQSQDAIAEAKLDGLVYCPFCNIPYELDKCVQVLECRNTKCLKASCIQCKMPPHLPLLCEEVQKMSDTALRREVEERMTKAVIRECNVCHAELIKIDGTCNKVRCRCGNTMCYVCRETISPMYNHFCSCRKTRAEPGKPCQICNRCSSMDKVAADNEALDAKEEALKELAHKEPKLLDLEIGPPLEKRKLHKRKLNAEFNEKEEKRKQPPRMQQRPPQYDRD